VLSLEFWTLFLGQKRVDNESFKSRSRPARVEFEFINAEGGLLTALSSVDRSKVTYFTGNSLAMPNILLIAFIDRKWCNRRHFSFRPRILVLLR
jgi:hypothetical protein